MPKKAIGFFICIFLSLINPAVISAEDAPINAAQIKRYEGIFGMCGPQIPLERRMQEYERTFQGSPWINGIMIIEGWKAIQPQPDKFDWSQVDKLIALAARYNRKVSLFFVSFDAPQWVYQQGVSEFKFSDKNPHHKTYGQKRIVPVPVSDEFYGLWSNFIREAGKRYDSNPAVAGVVIMGVNFHSGETYIPLRQQEEIEQAKKFNITPDNVLQYWKKYIDLYMQAFPSTVCKLHIAEMFRNDRTVLDRVVAYGAERYPGRFQIQTNKLNGKGDQNGQHEYDLIMQYSSKITVGFQMLASFKDRERQGSMLMTLVNGVRAQAKYYELWFGDATDQKTSKVFYDLWQEGKNLGWEKLLERAKEEGDYTASGQKKKERNLQKNRHRGRRQRF